MHLDYAIPERTKELLKARSLLRGVNACCIFGSVVLIAMSIWPGYASSCFAILLLPVIGILGLVWLLTAIRAIPKPIGAGVPIELRKIVFAPVVVVLTLAVLYSAIPMRVAFAMSRSSFDRMVATLPKSAPSSTPPASSMPPHVRVGMYIIDRVSIDPRGGIFFRTGTASAMIDTISFGFVYQPNSVGTPFGRAGYELESLGGGWYSFSVSNDY